jgi:hypothetical protein
MLGYALLGVFACTRFIPISARIMAKLKQAAIANVLCLIVSS